MLGYCFTCGSRFDDALTGGRECKRCAHNLTWGMEAADAPPAYAVAGNSLMAPFRILVDTQEKLAYTFPGIRTDAKQGRRPLFVPLEACSLYSGDYSISGYAEKVAVERKSYSDLASTLIHERGRFERELQRLNEMAVAWVVCEASLRMMMDGPPWFSKVNPKALWRSIYHFEVRYPRVHWWLCEGREVAEVVTYRLLESWWRVTVEEPERERERKAKQQRGGK